MYKVCVVVVTHNRKQLLQRCIKALTEQTYVLDHIMVIDNGSDDGTDQIIPVLENISYVRLAENMGGSFGFFKGAQIAVTQNYDYIWFMDDDCIPERDALKCLIRYASDCPVLCPSVVAQDGNFDLVHRRTVDLKSLKEKFIEAEEYENDCVEIDLFSFVGVLISSKILKDVGLPRSDLFFQYDDTELSLRIRRAGEKIALIPDSRILHAGSLCYPAAVTKLKPIRHYYSIRNRVFVYSIYRRTTISFVLFVVLDMIKSLRGLYKIRSLSIGSIALTIRAYFNGICGNLNEY